MNIFSAAEEQLIAVEDKLQQKLRQEEQLLVGEYKLRQKLRKEEELHSIKYATSQQKQELLTSALDRQVKTKKELEWLWNKIIVIILAILIIVSISWWLAVTFPPQINYGDKPSHLPYLLDIVR